MIFYRYALVAMVLLGSHSCFGWSDKQYSNVALNDVHQRSQYYLNISTNEVAKKLETEEDVAECFKKEFLTAPEEGEEISEARKTRAVMQVVRKGYNQDAASGFAAEATSFHQYVSIEFQNKEEALEREIANLWMKKYGSGTVTTIGAICLCTAIAMKGGHNNKEVKLALGTIGGVATVVGGACLYSTVGKERLLRIHIGQVQTMKDGWEKSFEIKKN